MEDFLRFLKEAERDLVREVEPERMADLDEDELLALHKRVRKARNKHVSAYRRKSARRVAEAGGRGTARPGNRKALARAEVFEEALARVSERLAVVAHEEAEALKRERLARARKGRSSGPAAGPTETGGTGEGRARSHAPTTGDVKRDASSRAQGARRQAARDGR